jgi:hypothetical protein
MAIKSPQKFTKEELDELSNLQTEINKLTVKFGSLQLSKIRLEKEEKELKNQLIILEKEEKEVAKKLTKKYGKGRLDTETGEFTPVE